MHPRWLSRHLQRAVNTCAGGNTLIGSQMGSSASYLTTFSLSLSLSHTHTHSLSVSFSLSYFRRVFLLVRRFFPRLSVAKTLALTLLFPSHRASFLRRHLKHNPLKVRCTTVRVYWERLGELRVHYTLARSACVLPTEPPIKLKQRRGGWDNGRNLAVVGKDKNWKLIEGRLVPAAWKDSWNSEEFGKSFK